MDVRSMKVGKVKKKKRLTRCHEEAKSSFCFGQRQVPERTKLSIRSTYNAMY